MFTVAAASPLAAAFTAELHLVTATALWSKSEESVCFSLKTFVELMMSGI